MKNKMTEKDEKIRFEDLSLVLKVAIISGLVHLGFFLIGFFQSFIMGFIKGYNSVVG